MTCSCIGTDGGMDERKKKDHVEGVGQAAEPGARDGWMDGRRKGVTAADRLSFSILNKETRGGENMAVLCHITLTSTSIPSVIFPLCYNKRRCTGSALTQVELQAGVCTALKEG